MFAGSLLARVCESEDKYYIHYIFQINVKKEIYIKGFLRGSELAYKHKTKNFLNV